MTLYYWRALKTGFIAPTIADRSASLACSGSGIVSPSLDGAATASWRNDLLQHTAKVFGCGLETQLFSTSSSATDLIGRSSE